VSARTSLRPHATTGRVTSSPARGAGLLGKVADEIASAKLVIPWPFGALGADLLGLFSFAAVTFE